ncbi:sodium:solute symporter [Haloarcula sp. JP-L23]|uniref:sodium:solute symporter family protein n=1 Tax=Haloarcula sp. JP-L23 TaxID=2716717 RepID=UPI00140F4368|nr:sodium:solute symporter family protein [Haloarcula sp. JP-L23]
MAPIPNDVVFILAIVTVYLLVVLGVGQYAARQTGNSREDYLMASRSFGTLILLAALFATNMSAVTMIGAPALAYNIGPNALGFFVGLFPFLFSVLMMTSGYRIWLVGKKFGHITPGQVVNHRWNSKYLGLLVTGLFMFWTVPYLLVGVQGAGIVFEALTDGVIPYWAGGLTIVAIVFTYVYSGGMRGTGWTNAFQGAFFLVLLLAFATLIPLRLGGFEAATQASLQVNPDLVNRANIPTLQPKEYFSVGILVSLETFILPHLFMRYMTGNSVRELKQTAVVYPVAIVLSWVPAVLIGFWGVGQFPDIANTDFILPMLINETFPAWVVGLALAGILAAMMSTLDGQSLTLGTMFTEDILRPFTDITERREVLVTRGFILLLLVLAWVGSLLTRDSVINTTIFAFTGYALMFFPIVSAFYSERVTKYASGAGLLVGFFGHWAFELGVIPQTLTLGFLQVIPLLVVQLVVMIVVTAATPKPKEDRIEEYRELFDGTW